MGPGLAKLQNKKNSIAQVSPLLVTYLISPVNNMDRNYILYDDSSDSENYAPLQSSQSGPIVTIAASPPRADLEEFYYMEDHTEYNIHDSD